MGLVAMSFTKQAHGFPTRPSLTVGRGTAERVAGAASARPPGRATGPAGFVLTVHPSELALYLLEERLG